MNPILARYKDWAKKHPKFSFFIAVWVILAFVSLIQDAMMSPEQRAAEMAEIADRQRAAQVAREAEEARRASEALEEAAACSIDARCIGRRYQVEAGLMCDREVASVANFAHEWSNTPKLTLMEWLDDNHTVIRYRGQVSFQNGFGVWSDRYVTCDYNVKEQVFLGLTL